MRDFQRTSAEICAHFNGAATGTTFDGAQIGRLRDREDHVNANMPIPSESAVVDFRGLSIASLRARNKLSKFGDERTGGARLWKKDVVGEAKGCAEAFLNDA